MGASTTGTAQQHASRENGARAPSVHHGRDTKLGLMERSGAGGGMTRARAEGELGLQLGGITGEEAPTHRGGRAGDGRWLLAAGEQGDRGRRLWLASSESGNLQGGIEPMEEQGRRT
ncbi:hypothetical protein ZEAMMB73_Zm00001d036662 [Zea mays]|uniref:Uncharacterized protein n=1 Tax=Zea mays TaxID=4577 RepID=A0A1D6LQ75_MAIZE|nr:hypothetical protein ZEAMMB73_Zm00001d036662 [Zea mays]